MVIEFIHLIASEANDICDKEAKKTIAGEHIVSALRELGFEEYIEDVEEVYKEHRQQQKVKFRRWSIGKVLLIIQSCLGS